MVLMKQIAQLDQGCVELLANSPIAGFGYRDQEGNGHTTLVGGAPGFMRVESPTRISFDLGEKLHGPTKKGGVSFVFLLPGVGEVLRLNGTISALANDRITIAVEEAYIHCARAILRSRLWSEPQANGSLPEDNLGEEISEPLHHPTIAKILAASPFVFLSSWDANGASDTSPRGDDRGFVQLLDGKTLALPDRKGNQRTDTFHNILSNNQISLVALVPGSTLLLHISGKAALTTEETLLATMALNGKPPHAALTITVKSALLEHSEAIQQAKLWLLSSHVDQSNVPDMMALTVRHLALNESPGMSAKIGRFLSRLLSGSPKFIRTLINFGYQKELKAEGYASTKDGESKAVKRELLTGLLLKLPAGVRQKAPILLQNVSAYLSRVASAVDDSTPIPTVSTGKLPTRQVRVVDIKRETADAVTLSLEDTSGGVFEFKPGQFFTVLLTIHGEQVMRSYSASNAPGTSRLTMTIKKVADGLCSTYINQTIKAGDTLGLLGPSGSFCVTPDPAASREYVLLAGGSGITPMMSIARAVLATESGSKVSLLYGNRAWEDVIFAQAWTELSQQYPDRLNMRHVLSSPPTDWQGGIGRLDEATARQELINLEPSDTAHFYVCGPEPMMKGVKDALIGLGVSSDRIHEERFSSTLQREIRGASISEIPQTMTVQQNGASIGEVLVPVGKTLLQAGLNAHVPMSFSCGMGNCGECRVKLVRGDVKMAEPNCLSAGERNQGFILACVARPVTATTIEL